MITMLNAELFDVNFTCLCRLGYYRFCVVSVSIMSRFSPCRHSPHRTRQTKLALEQQGRISPFQVSFVFWVFFVNLFRKDTVDLDFRSFLVFFSSSASFFLPLLLFFPFLFLLLLLLLRLLLCLFLLTRGLNDLCRLLYFVWDGLLYFVLDCCLVFRPQTQKCCRCDC